MVVNKLFVSVASTNHVSLFGRNKGVNDVIFQLFNT